jgi:predicted ATPase/DNA-binding SARP family transcriptional activator
LGPVSVVSVHPAAPNPAALGGLASNVLAALVLAKNHMCSVETLIDAVWEDEPPAAPKQALQAVISRLRRATGLDVRSVPGGYAMDADTDLDQACALAASAAAALPSDPELAAAQSAQALGLWRGEPGTGGIGSIGQQLLSQALGLRHDLHLVHARALVALGHADQAAAELAPLETDTLDDTLVLALMQALQESGRTNEALDCYARYAERLADSLGSDPTPTLTDYHTLLLRGCAPSLAPAVSHRPTWRVGLRHALTPLVGRESDLARLQDLLATSRLLTIHGPGGIGKTQLAQALGHDCAASGRSVVFVELAGVRVGEDVPGVIAACLETPAMAAQIAPGQSGTLNRLSPHDSLMAELEGSHTVLILDNCEQVRDAAALWIRQTLDATTDLTILTTSRVPMGISGEVVYPLAPLPTHTESGEPGPAVTLFLNRARAVRSDVLIDLGAVERLCDRLDGLPLAIELAAARVQVMSLSEIEQGLDNRFSLLTSQDVTGPERHRTLRALIEWSWDLLTAGQQTLLARASIAPDGFSAILAAYLTAAGIDNDSAPQVADVMGDIEALTLHSLIRLEESPVGAPSRFRMVETIREFAAEQLRGSADAALALQRYLAWACTFSSRTIRAMNSSDQIAAFAATKAESKNLTDALRQGATDTGQPDTDTVLTVFALLALWLASRFAFPEIAPLADIALYTCQDCPPTSTDPVMRVNYVLALCFMTVSLMIVTGPDDRVRQAATLLRDHVAEPPSSDEDSASAIVMLLAQVALTLSSDDSRASVDESPIDSPDPATRCLAMMFAAMFSESHGDVARSIDFGLRSYRLATQLGNIWFQGLSASITAGFYAEMGDPVQAMMWAKCGDEHLYLLGADPQSGDLGQLKAFSLLAAHDLTAARAGFEDLLVYQGNDGPPDRLLMARIGLAEVLLAEGDVVQGLAAYRSIAYSPEVDHVSPDAWPTLSDTTEPLALRADLGPWIIMVDSACLAAHVLAGAIDQPDLPPIAHRLALSVVTLSAVPDVPFDVPVLGCAALGLGAWITATTTDPAGPELVSLAERLASRQDIPALNREAHWNRVEAAREPGMRAKLTADTAHREIDACVTDTLARIQTFVANQL